MLDQVINCDCRIAGVHRRAKDVDHLVDFGPGPGVKGGEVIAQGSIADLASAPESLTGAYLAGTKAIAIPKERRVPADRFLTIKAARHNNLKGIDRDFPGLIDLTELFDYPTIAQLAKHLESKLKAKHPH